MSGAHEPSSHIRSGPDALTSHLANGGALADEEEAWISRHLERLRASAGADAPADDGISLKDLKSVYLGARVIQGGVIASQLALPAVVDAGQTLRDLPLPDGLGSYALLGAAQTELFLSGAADGRPREGNDFPPIVKKYISAIAGLLNRPYETAYDDLAANRPDLRDVALDADELQRLCWGRIRWEVNKVVPADELAYYRAKPLQDGTDELLALIKDRTGVALPPRVVQRDSQDYIDPGADWQAALRDARQDPRLALLAGIRFSVENAEIATLYCLGSLLMRITAGGPTRQVLTQQIRYGVQDIASGTRLVTHNARFQSRLGARPNYFRSFEQFLRNVRKQIDISPVHHDGQIDWFDTHSSQQKGWCPAQNRYHGKHPGELAGHAQKASEAVASWRTYAQERFGVIPEYGQPTAGELLASIVLFTVLHEGSPLRPATTFMTELAAQCESCTPSAPPTTYQ